MSIEVRGNLPGLRRPLGTSSPTTWSHSLYHRRQRPAGHPDRWGSLGWGLPLTRSTTPCPRFLHYLFSAAGQAVAEKTFGVVPAVASLNGPTPCGAPAGGPANSEAYVIAANTATIAPQTPAPSHPVQHRRPQRRDRGDHGGQSIAKAFTNSKPRWSRPTR